MKHILKTPHTCIAHRFFGRYYLAVGMYGHSTTSWSIRTQSDIPVRLLNMQQIVDEVLQRLDPMIEESGVKLTVKSSWPAAQGYAGWLEEVWVNYLSNAVKFGGNPPEIELGADTFNGQGIPLEQQSRLFQEFTRVNDRSMDGHGPGLSIVRRIIEKLGGQVGVESTPGKGSILC